jgi:putative SbcD/Mre11-related phosphoesterase
MNRSRWSLAPDLGLDARRAAWLSDFQTLAIADLHLGYAWAHRHAGQLLPLTVPDDILPRALELVENYGARRLVILGDIVHRAVALPAIKDELCAFFGELADRVELVFLGGNHDRGLNALLRECRLPIQTGAELPLGRFLLAHGDTTSVDRAGAELLIMGHEHPAISLSDEAAGSAKCPCFLVSDSVLILPAFSRWAAGSNVRNGTFLSAAASAANFTRAVAIVADKLVPVALEHTQTRPGRRSTGDGHASERTHPRVQNPR